MGEREQILNFLLAKCDEKNTQIADLQKQVSELTKKLADAIGTPTK